MPNPTHDEQIDHYLRCALNVAHAGYVDGVIPFPWGYVALRLRYLQGTTLPFTEQPARSGRKHSDPARGEMAGAASDALVGHVEESTEL